MQAEPLQLQLLPQSFSVCRAEDLSSLASIRGLFFAARTGLECSLVCETACAPTALQKRTDGWRAFRVAAQLDFSLVGILADLACVLKNAGVSIFAVSTYDTDYLLVRSFQLALAQTALRQAGYVFIG